MRLLDLQATIIIYCRSKKSLIKKAKNPMKSEIVAQIFLKVVSNSHAK